MDSSIGKNSYNPSQLLATAGEHLGMFGNATLNAYSQHRDFVDGVQSSRGSDLQAAPVPSGLIFHGRMKSSVCPSIQEAQITV